MKLKIGDTYYFIVVGAGCTVETATWTDSELDRCRVDNNNVFLTVEDAHKALEAVNAILKEFHEKFDITTRYPSKYFRYHDIVYELIGSDGKEITYRNVATGKEYASKIEGVDKWVADGLTFVKPVPWTFETAPDIIKVKDKNEGNIDLLSLDLTNVQGDIIVGMFSDVMERVFPLEVVFERFEGIDGTICGHFEAINNEESK